MGYCRHNTALAKDDKATRVMLVLSFEAALACG